MSHFFLYSNDDILLMILKLPDNDRVAVWMVVDGYSWLWIDMDYGVIVKVKDKKIFSLFRNISYFISLTLSVAQVGHHLVRLGTTMLSIAKTVMPKRISSKVWQYFVDDKDGEYASCLLCKYHPSNGVTIFVG